MRNTSQPSFGQLFTDPNGDLAVSRRAQSRHPCAANQTLTILVRPGLVKRQVRLVNVGLNGLAFLCEVELPGGSVMALQRTAHTPQGSWIRSGRILHCTPRPEGDYLVGIEVTPYFSAEELERLIDPLARA